MAVRKAKQNGWPLWRCQLVLLLSPKDKVARWFCKYEEILPEARGHSQQQGTQKLMGLLCKRALTKVVASVGTTHPFLSESVPSILIFGNVCFCCQAVCHLSSLEAMAALLKEG